MKKIALFCCILLLSSCFLAGEKSAPPFNSIDLQGNSINEQQLNGKITLINFWYPSCPGCVIEMPKLIELHQKMHGKPYQTLAISLNYNTLAEVKTYSQTRKLPFIILYDTDNSISESYGVELTPSTLLIDQQGHIVRRYIGEPDWTDLQQRIDKLLTP